MLLQFVYILYLTNIVISEEPKVYEIVDEAVEENIRTPRHPQKYRSAVTYSPPVFNYHTAAQQDMQKFRYYQQQLVDAYNFARNQRLFRPQRVVPEAQNFGEITKPPSYTWKVAAAKETAAKNVSPVITPQIWHVPDPKINHQNRRSVNIILPIEEVHLTTPTSRKTKRADMGTFWKSLVEIGRRKKPTSSTSSYQVEELDLDTSASEIRENREQHIALPNNYIQNQHAIFINPETGKTILKGDMAGYAMIQKQEKNVEALNALIGKTPQVQLEGLKKLLDAPSQTKIIIPVISGPQPFQPSKVEQAKDLAHLQAQLDAAAQAQAQQVLAQAQQEAIAHVKAQHEAIAVLQAQAQKAALDQFAQHNQENAAPQALALVQIEPTQQDHKQLVQPQPYDGHHQNHNYNQHQEQQPQNYVPIQNHPQNSGNVQQQQQQNFDHVQAQSQYYGHDQAHNQEIQIMKKTQNNPPNLRNFPQQPLEHIQAQSQYHGHDQNQLSQTPQNHQRNSEHLKQQHNDHVPAQSQYYGHDQIQIQQIYSTPIPRIPQVSGAHPAISDENKHYDDQLQYAAQYAFGYRIRDAHNGNDFGHEEKRDGETAKGHYHVLLPDGRTQNVEYWADESGYHAKVTYTNFAKHQ